MKLDIETLKKTFKLGWDTYLPSKIMANEVEELFHGEHYTDDELVQLENEGRRPEINNLIRKYTNSLKGYYSKVSNTAIVQAKKPEDTNVAGLINDLFVHIDDDNRIDTLNDRLRQDGLLAGLMVSEITAVKSRNADNSIERDYYGRVVYEIVKRHIPWRNVVLDPNSKNPDYSDANFLHVIKWMTKNELLRIFKESDIRDLDTNNSNVAGTEVFQFDECGKFQNNYINEDNYLIVRTIAMDDKGLLNSIYWSGDKILKSEIIRDGISPYQVVRLNDNYKPEYYGIFKDSIQTQKNINGAILQRQLLINTNKMLVRKGAVEGKNWDRFIKEISKPNSIVEVDELDSIRILNSNVDVAHQENIIAHGEDRILSSLGLNNSFLGQAFASDSGRKVKLQQNAATVGLSYIDTKFELLYRLMGESTLHKIKHYYKATRDFRVKQSDGSIKWVLINAPLVNPETGEVITSESIDPDTGKPEVDEYGNIILVPYNNHDTDVSFANVDVTIKTVPYNDEDEKTQLTVETILNGPIGNTLRQDNLSAYYTIASLLVKGMKVRNTDEITKILDESARRVAYGNQVTQETEEMSGKAPMSSTLRLPRDHQDTGY